MYLVFDQISICIEVEAFLMVIHDGRHSALPDSFYALVLRSCDLLLDAFRVVMLNLLKPIF